MYWSGLAAQQLLGPLTSRRLYPFFPINSKSLVPSVIKQNVCWLVTCSLLSTDVIEMTENLQAVVSFPDMCGSADGKSGISQRIKREMWTASWR